METNCLIGILGSLIVSVVISGMSLNYSFTLKKEQIKIKKENDEDKKYIKEKLQEIEKKINEDKK